MHLVVVGASLAGLKTVEAACRRGVADRISLIGAEPHLPYNRPPLSKEFLTAAPANETLTFQPDSHFEKLGVELRLGTPADGLDLQAQEVQVGGERIAFDALVIATGTAPRKLPVGLPGRDLANVHYLRTLDDALALRSALTTGRRVVVVGGGFIGAEVAAAASKLGAQVTVVEAAEIPLVRAVGEHIGSFCAGLHGLHGVELITGVSVTGLHGPGAVREVTLSDGRSLEADVVVVGIGAAPAVEWLRGSGLDISNGVLADEYLNVGHPGVYAVGDIVRWPNPLWPGTMRLESWTSVVEQAERAVANLANPGAPTPCTVVPYFWSDQYGIRLQSLGVPTGEPLVVHGSQEAARFVALYRREDTLSGVFASNCPHLIMKFRPLLQRRATWQEALDFAVAKMPSTATQVPA